MTREERDNAITILENEKKCVNRANKNDYCNRDCYNCELVKTDIEILTALDMAIQALEQSMPTMVYPQVDGITPTVVAQADGEYKSNKELLCDSCYRKIAGCQAKFHNPHPVDHCIEYKPIEKQADGEYISRTELLKAIDTWDKFGCDADTKLVPYQDHYIPYIHYDDVIKCIKGMPSVKPQEKTGHWIEDTNGTYTDNHDTWECSECGNAQILLEGTPKDNDYNYCPNCGARMD